MFEKKHFTIGSDKGRYGLLYSPLVGNPERPSLGGNPQRCTVGLLNGRGHLCSICRFSIPLIAGFAQEEQGKKALCFKIVVLLALLWLTCMPKQCTYESTNSVDDCKVALEQQRWPREQTDVARMGLIGLKYLLASLFTLMPNVVHLRKSKKYQSACNAICDHEDFANYRLWPTWA